MLESELYTSLGLLHAIHSHVYIEDMMSSSVTVISNFQASYYEEIFASPPRTSLIVLMELFPDKSSIVFCIGHYSYHTDGIPWGSHWVFDPESTMDGSSSILYNYGLKVDNIIAHSV